MAARLAARFFEKRGLGLTEREQATGFRDRNTFVATPMETLFCGTMKTVGAHLGARYFPNTTYQDWGRLVLRTRKISNSL